MVASRLASLIRTVFSVLAFSVLSFGVFSTQMPSLVSAAPYGSCTYSSGQYDKSGACAGSGQTTNSGGLSSTGENMYLIYSVIGLLLFVGSAAVLFRVISKKSRRKEQ